MSQDIPAITMIPRYGRQEIARRVKELAAEIDSAYGEQALVAICVLKGAFIYFSDLIREIRNPNLEVDFVRLASYGMNSASSKHVIFSKDIEVDILGKHVLIVEDVVDSGHTMRFLLDQLAARNPVSLAITALIDKRERREADIDVAFSGFVLSEGFIAGYGMDYAERFRGMPDICELKGLPS